MQCFKCKQGIGTIASRDGVAKLYCADCFLSYCAGAVRENLFQHCLVPGDTPLAVAVSGGPNSMMLLRELGELRHATREALRRQHAVQEHRRRLAEAVQQQMQVRDAAAAAAPAEHPRHAEASEDATEACSSSASTPGPNASVSSLILLPFYLCEEELVVPPLPSTATPSTTTASAPTTAASTAPPHDRQSAIEAVRAAMRAQFATLRKYVEQQPWRWSSVGHHREKATAQQRRGTADTAAPIDGRSAHAGDRPAAAAAAASPAQLFDAGEVRVFCYSDFLSASYIHEVRHALHASRLSLTDREALYSRVRQQTLCRAARRLCDEHRGGSVPDGGVGSASTTSATRNAAWSHLLLGSNAVRCATAALEALVTGAGGEGVVHGAGFRSFAHQVVSLRPLRTMLARETVQYTRLRGFACGYTPAPCTCTCTRSMHRTLEQFVLTMMAPYRTMIFNVLNTVQRLEVHPAAVQAVVKGPGATPTATASLADGGGAPQQQQPQRGKEGRKALPGRTAPQNRDDLLRVAPPVVQQHGNYTSSGALGNAGGDVVIGACCVCGCPAPVPAPPPSAVGGSDDSEIGCGGTHTTARHLELFSIAVAPLQGGLQPASASPDAAVANRLVCYACCGLAEAWPASCFPRGGMSHATATALQQLCALLQ